MAEKRPELVVTFMKGMTRVARFGRRATPNDTRAGAEHRGNGEHR
jgi:hypothetical protein